MNEYWMIHDLRIRLFDFVKRVSYFNFQHILISLSQHILYLFGNRNNEYVWTFHRTILWHFNTGFEERMTLFTNWYISSDKIQYTRYLKLQLEIDQNFVIMLSEIKSNPYNLGNSDRRFGNCPYSMECIWNIQRKNR